MADLLSQITLRRVGGGVVGGGGGGGEGLSRGKLRLKHGRLRKKKSLPHAKDNGLLGVFGVTSGERDHLHLCRRCSAIFLLSWTEGFSDGCKYG